jgi:Trypsin-like peptidase domain
MQAALKIAGIIAIAAAGCCPARAQAPGVPICDLTRQEPQSKTSLLNTAKAMFGGRDSLKPAQARKQLKRSSCQLALPEAKTQRLPARDICIAARRSHLRVGWSYLCPKCGNWHLNLAGGYVITTNGAVVTCFHVVEPGSDMRDGCLVAVDEEGTVFPVAEVLAANRESDACIVRVAGDGFKPLALNTDVFPGDTAYCYSDPVDHGDYFSAGIVNRFYQRPASRGAGARSSAGVAPMRINVSTDWAPGSSGSAVLDDCGNVIGHVAVISAVPDETAPKGQAASAERPAAIVFHEAVSARDVLRLIRPPKN